MTTSQTETLKKIIFDHSFRKNLVDGDHPLPHPDFSTIDKAQLGVTCQRLRVMFEEGMADPSRGLKTMFRLTFDVLATLDQSFTISDQVFSFLASKEFSKHSNVPYIRSDLSLEEAFYRFLMRTHRPTPVLLEEVARRDALTSLYRRLAVMQFPNFDISAGWARKDPSGWTTVQEFQYDLVEMRHRPHLYRYAAAKNIFKHGEEASLTIRLDADSSKKTKS